MDVSAFRRLGARPWALWAKSGVDGTDFMPLPRHLADAAGVADLLWDLRVPASVQRVVEESVGPGAPEDCRERARRIACFLAATHDVGKASPAFASQVPALVSRIEASGLEFPTGGFTADERRRCTHSSVSASALRVWLTERGVTGCASLTLGAVLAGHHGIYVQVGDLKRAEAGARGAGDQEWADVRAQLLTAAAATVGLEDSDLLALPERGLSQAAQLVLSGFVIVCDWIASNAELFPFQRLDHSEGDLVEAAIDAVGLTGPWLPVPPESDELFRSRFDFPDGAQPRPVQLAAAQLAAEIGQPELMIVEAPTGEGKTEAALAAAEIMAHRFGLGGAFVGLPTQATSDAMFHRILGWLGRALGSDQAASVSLSHGKAQFNRDLEQLRRPPLLGGVWDEPENSSAIRAHSWLTRKKAILANFVVGTIDQVLLMALQTRHVALRHFGLAGKVVILDEIHAADEFMLVYLTRALEWLAGLGVPVIALSATLPPTRRRALTEAYARGARRQDSSAVADLAMRAEEAVGYPLITTTDPALEPRSVAPSGRSISAEVQFIDDDDLVEFLVQQLAQGGCAAVVCNTVRRAQQAYRELRARFGENTVLLHSGFVTADRLRVEADLRAELGPPGGSRPRPSRQVVVSTQVIEQSLDVDFDLMITDLAPIDLVFQRMGRLHRHARPTAERPPGLAEPRLVIRGVTQTTDHPPDFDRGSIWVYGTSALLRSLSVLNDHLAQSDALSGVDHVAALVARAYDVDRPVPAGWEAVWREAEMAAAEKAADREGRARKFCVSAAKSGSLFGWMQVRISDDGDDGDDGQPAVRDIEDSIEAVLVIRDEQGRLRSLPWLEHHGNQLLDLGTQIESKLARAVATCTVRLPAYLARGELGKLLVRELEADGLETWQKSPWLRGMLPLAVGPDLTREIAGWVLAYDRELGLLVEREGAPTDG